MEYSILTSCHNMATFFIILLLDNMSEISEYYQNICSCALCKHMYPTCTHFSIVQTKQENLMYILMKFQRISRKTEIAKY